jgi:hypothetical protein
MLSKKLLQILFGKISKVEGGTPVRASLNYPELDGKEKKIYWEGNTGLIITMWEKIEKLESEIEEFKIKKH